MKGGYRFPTGLQNVKLSCCIALKCVLMTAIPALWLITNSQQLCRLYCLRTLSGQGRQLRSTSVWKQSQPWAATRLRRIGLWLFTNYFVRSKALGNNLFKISDLEDHVLSNRLHLYANGDIRGFSLVGTGANGYAKISIRMSNDREGHVCRVPKKEKLGRLWHEFMNYEVLSFSSYLRLFPQVVA